MTRRFGIYTGVTLLLIVLLVLVFNLNISTSISADSRVVLFLDNSPQVEQVTIYSRPTSNIEDYQNYALLDLNYAVYSYNPLLTNTEESRLPAKSYLYPYATRRSGWEIGQIFSREISGEKPFSSPSGAYSYYPQPYISAEKAIVPDLVFHNAETNNAQVLSGGEEPVWIVSDLYIEGDYLWFYYLLDADVGSSHVWTDFTTLPVPTKYMLNTNRMFQRRYNLRTLEAQTTEVCLTDKVLGERVSFYFQSPDLIIVNVQQAEGYTGFVGYPGFCHLEMHQLSETHRLDKSQPAWQVPKRIVPK